MKVVEVVKQYGFISIANKNIRQNQIENIRPVSLNIPRNRNGEFEPQIIPKHQRTINGIEDKVLSLYSKGITTRDISEQIKELYEVDTSAETVSNITNRISPLVSEWQNRPLEKHILLYLWMLFTTKLEKINI
nr:transposase [Clostridium gasigenes]